MKKEGSGRYCPKCGKELTHKEIPLGRYNYAHGYEEHKSIDECPDFKETFRWWIFSENNGHYHYEYDSDREMDF